MRINYSCIYWLFIALLAFQSAYGQNEIADKDIQNISVNQSDLRVENLKKQASELFEAYDKGNIDMFIALTYSKVLEKDDSGNNFVELLKDVIEYQSEVYKDFHSSVENPSELSEIDNQLFGVVPYKLEGTNSRKIKVVKLASMVGVSEDKGKSWKFINGAAFNKFFPDIASRIPIPNERGFVNDIEQ